jgi:hypothetical protein
LGTGNRAGCSTHGAKGPERQIADAYQEEPADSDPDNRVSKLGQHPTEAAFNRVASGLSSHQLRSEELSCAPNNRVGHAAWQQTRMQDHKTARLAREQQSSANGALLANYKTPATQMSLKEKNDACS